MWWRIKMCLLSLGTHLRANRDLYKKFSFITLVGKKKNHQRLIFFLWLLLTFCYWPKIIWLENVQYIKKKKREEFNRKFTFREKNKMTLPLAFSSKSQTFPPKKWDRRQSKVTAVAVQRPRQNQLPDAREKGTGRCLVWLLPDFKAKLFLYGSDTPLTSSGWKATL